MSERLERGGPCWLLKLRWMGTQRVQLKGILPWLVRWACRAGTRDFFSALSALVSSMQNIFFPHHTLFKFLCSHRPAIWAGSRAGSPFSWYVFLCMPKSLSLACLSLGEPFHELSFHLLKCVEDPFWIVNLPLCESEDKGQLFHRWDGL